jgi:hypothetical protein
MLVVINLAIELLKTHIKAIVLAELRVFRRSAN